MKEATEKIYTSNFKKLENSLLFIVTESRLGKEKGRRHRGKGLQRSLRKLWGVMDMFTILIAFFSTGVYTV